MLFAFIVAAGNVNVVVPKSSLLNQAFVNIDATLAPVVKVRLGAVADVPGPDKLFPTENDLVIVIGATVNPPGPVYVNPVRSFKNSTSVLSIVCARLILPALVLPNAIERVFVLSDLNIPVVNVTPSANVNVPAVKVYVELTANVVVTLILTAPALCKKLALTFPPLKLTVPVVKVNSETVIKLPVGKVKVAPLIVTELTESVPLIVVTPVEQVNVPIVAPFPIIVPLPTIITFKLEFILVVNVKLFKFSVTISVEQVLPVKSNLLK